MTTGLKLGSGYARWRPPSKVAAFVRRWRRMVAISVSLLALAVTAVSMARLGKARAAADARTRQYAIQLRTARERAGHDVVPTEHQEMAAFTASLTNEQVHDLAAGKQIEVSRLTAKQQAWLETYVRPVDWLKPTMSAGDRQGFDVSSVSYFVGTSPRGPTFRIGLIRKHDGKPRTGLYCFPPEWVKGESANAP
jgi:type II secretory pathway pseudopilin PulG